MNKLAERNSKPTILICADGFSFTNAWMSEKENNEMLVIDSEPFATVADYMCVKKFQKKEIKHLGIILGRTFSDVVFNQLLNVANIIYIDLSDTPSRSSALKSLGMAKKKCRFILNKNLNPLIEMELLHTLMPNMIEEELNSA